jgi:hypothetical protein
VAFVGANPNLEHEREVKGKQGNINNKQQKQ